jgi:hypothetical protein
VHRTATNESRIIGWFPQQARCLHLDSQAARLKQLCFTCTGPQFVHDMHGAAPVHDLPLSDECWQSRHEVGHACKQHQHIALALANAGPCVHQMHQMHTGSRSHTAAPS